MGSAGPNDTPLADLSTAATSLSRLSVRGPLNLRVVVLLLTSERLSWMSPAVLAAAGVTGPASAWRSSPVSGGLEPGLGWIRPCTARLPTRRCRDRTALGEAGAGVPRPGSHSSRAWPAVDFAAPRFRAET